MENGLMDLWLPGVRDWGVQGMDIAIMREYYYNGTVECLDCGGRYPSYTCDRIAQNYTHTHTNEYIYIYNW